MQKKQNIKTLTHHPGHFRLDAQTW